MNINSLLNQTITIYHKNSYSADGRETVGAAQSIPARFLEVNKSRLLPNQQVVTIEGVVYLKADQAIAVNDRITYDGVDYKVHGKKVARGANGASHHQTIEVKKWQT